MAGGSLEGDGEGKEKLDLEYWLGCSLLGGVIIMIVIIIIIIIIIIINQRETLLVLCGLVALAQGERAEPDIKITRWNKRPANYSHLVILKVKVKKPNILKGRVRVEQQACKS